MFCIYGMPTDWYEACFALSVAIVVASWRVFKFRSADGNFLASVIEAFLGGALVPVAAVLIVCPLYEKLPDLSHFRIYLAVSGIALSYVAFVIIRRSIQPERPPENTPKQS